MEEKRSDAVALVRVVDLDALRGELRALREAVDALTLSRPVANENASESILEPARAVYMSPADFARHVGVSPRTIRSLLKTGLPRVKVSRYTRIPVAAAEAWLASDRDRTGT